MAEIGSGTLVRGVIRLVDDNVQVTGQNGGVGPQQIKVKPPVLDELGESQRPEVADRRLVGRCVLNDFGAEVA